MSLRNLLLFGFFCRMKEDYIGWRSLVYLHSVFTTDWVQKLYNLDLVSSLKKEDKFCLAYFKIYLFFFSDFKYFKILFHTGNTKLAPVRMNTDFSDMCRS